LNLFNCFFLLDLLCLINIKLIRNWTYWVNLSLEFNELCIWDICLDLESSPEFSCFFPLNLMFFFQLYHLAFISLVIRLCFFFLIFLLYDFFNSVFLIVSCIFLVFPYISLFFIDLVCAMSPFFSLISFFMIYN